MKKLISLLMIILIISVLINVKTFAVTLPELEITSNHYSAGDKKNLEDTKYVTAGKTLQLYAIMGYGNDLWDPENPDSIGWFVLQSDLEGVEWTSSDNTIATVDNTGKVTGILAGETTIFAKYNDETANYKITVLQQNKKLNYNLQVSYLDYKTATTPSEDETKTPIPATLPTYHTFNVNDKIQLYAGLMPDDDSIPSEEISKLEIQWLSSDSNIATIDNNGVLTLLKEGNVDIKASCVLGETVYMSIHGIEVKSPNTDSPINPNSSEETEVHSPVNEEYSPINRVDETTVNKNLPKTGNNTLKIIIGILITALISIIMYKRFKDVL